MDVQPQKKALHAIARRLKTSFFVSVLNVRLY